MKRRVEELAALGGSALFAQPLHVGRPNIPDKTRVLARVGAALDNAWLTNDGPLVRELERRLADYLQVEHCVAMANGTAALEVTARALGLRGEVIVPAFTFIATPHAFTWLNLTPIFCDVDPQTHMLDVRAAERCITERTSAIAPVHLWGHACDVAAIEQLAEAHKLRVIYDAAHALGVRTGSKSVGGFGDAEIFSFHATKFFNTFEGGAVTTRDGELAARLRLLRNFGFAGYDDVVDIGTNAKLSEAHAAMGLEGLEDIDRVLVANQSNWRHYDQALQQVAQLRLVRPPAGQQSNYQYVVCEVAAGAPLTRDQLLNVLWQENVRARRYFFPGCHRTAFYHSAKSLPVTEELAARVLVLPAGATVSGDDVDRVVGLLRLACSHADVLRDRLPAYLPPGALKA